MEWLDVVWTLIFVLIGYLIGSISNAIILCKMLGKEDVRTKGSGNAGATNVLRNYGKKMGLLVFMLDILKTVVAVMIAWSFQKYSKISHADGIMLQAVAIAVIVGHMFPIFFKFQGGKGAASTAGMYLVIDWPLFFIGIVIFIAIVMITRMVSLGSIMAILILILIQIGLAQINDQDIVNPLMQNYPWWCTTIFMSIGWILVTFKHSSNIKRIIQKKERKI